MSLENFDIEALRHLIDTVGQASEQRNRWSGTLSPSLAADHGASVIIATRLGSGRIREALESLLNQTLSWTKYEVVVVHNGPDDGTRELVTEWRKCFPAFNVRYVYVKRESAGHARNIGIRAARFSYVTFVDDDDSVQPAFLEQLLSVAAPDRIAISPILDRSPDGALNENSLLNKRISALSSMQTVLINHSWVFGFNASKLVSRDLARSVRQPENLKSGEDVVFWSKIASVPGLSLVRVRELNESAYIRTLRSSSVSRQEPSFNFMVRDRLDVIRLLGGFEADPNRRQRSLAATLAVSQFGFIQTYIQENPEDFPRLLSAVRERKLTGLPWTSIKMKPARDLVISYCFAPFSDPSAIVAAKVISERARRVDVIANHMEGQRRLDYKLAEVAAEWVNSLTVIDSQPSFAGWLANCEFAQKALTHIQETVRKQGPYLTVYSRALWIGSHLAAALYKLSFPETVWTAEFSDPLRFGVDGSKREGELIMTPEASTLFSAIRSRGYSVHGIETPFDLIEIATYVLADEVIFTNENQQEFMLKAGLPRRLADQVRNKSTVRRHPTPNPEMYNLVSSDYELDREVVNVAYFGSFYKNRGLDDVLIALQNLPEVQKKQIVMHVFCNSPDEVLRRGVELGIAKSLRVNPYVDYLEFLNLIQRFDALLVNDVQFESVGQINPFLPSKYSDYVGSGSKIWTIFDRNSALSGLPADYKTPVGSVAAIVETLRRIILDCSMMSGEGYE